MKIDKNITRFEIKNDIEDILIDLDMKGYKYSISIKRHPNSEKHIANISINNYNDFKIEDIEHYINLTLIYLDNKYSFGTRITLYDNENNGLFNMIGNISDVVEYYNKNFRKLKSHIKIGSIKFEIPFYIDSII
jgi:hypothetical protein